MDIVSDRANVIHFEILSIGIVSSIISYLIFMVLSIYIPIIKSIIYYNTFVLFLGYFVLNIMFNYFISRRLNKRIFKNTVATSFKSEVIDNA